MGLIQQLHQEEKNKNYKEFCKIADSIIDSSDIIAPESLIRQIKERRDFYLNKLINERSNKIKAFHIIEKLDPDTLNVLQKCCPGLNNFIDSQIDGISGLDFHQSGSQKERILDALITKNKELRVFWDEDSANPEEDIYFFQVPIEAEFGVTALRYQFIQEFRKKSKQDLLVLDNEFMPIFIVFFNTSLNIIDSVKCIPFPSALRGSYHYSELVNYCSEYKGISAFDHFSKHLASNNSSQKIQKIFINPENYDVGLVYSNEDFRRWVCIVHGISIVKSILPDSEYVLCLPENSYPTISAIINGFLISSFTDDSLDSANILIVDDSDNEP